MTTNSISLTKSRPCFQGIFPDPGVAAALSARMDGNMSLSYGDTQYSLRNRREFLSRAGIHYEHLVAARQVHSGNVYYVDSLDRGRGADSYNTSIPDTDALVTDKRHVPLGILTADCPGIFLFDAKTPAIGLVHAGWKGTKEKIIVNTLHWMRHYCGSKIEDISVFLGPAVRACCYEVGEEFRGFFPHDVKVSDGRFYCDLAGVNIKQALDAGVKRERISDCGVCTCCNAEDCFSFRREGHACGRHLSVMMLV